MSEITARLRHQRKVSRDARLDLQHQGHDGKRDRATSFRGCSGDQRAEDHGDGHCVVSREVLEVVVPEGEAPPHGVVKHQRDEDADEPPVLDQDPLVERRIGIEGFKSCDLRLFQFLAWSRKQMISEVSCVFPKKLTGS